MRVLGIMSGTSLDGVDFGLCEIARGRIKLLELWSRPFPANLRSRLRNTAAGEADSHELAQLHHDLGRFYARHAGNGKQSPDLIGLHGQTIYHNPAKIRPATLQIGEPAYLCETLRCPVVSNFRAGDIAAGGQGAPLATAFHATAFAVPGKNVAVNNLGGISNVSWLGQETRSFDTGPGVMLIDLAMRTLTKGRRRMDRNGQHAARGQADESALKRWLRHPFFRAKPPKSTGREMFGEVFLERALRDLEGASTEDIIATLTEFTARSLALNYERHLESQPDRVVLCGGGAANRTLVNRIRAALGLQIELLSSKDLGWPLPSVEPAAFAWLAWLRWKRKPWPHPETTGAQRPALLGQLTEP